MSKLRRQKLADRFNQLDTDKDGYVDQTDLDLRARRICDDLVPSEREAARDLILEGYQQLWQLLAQADEDHDGQVSHDEFTTALASGVLADPDAFHRCVARIATGLFVALDADDDNQLSFDEVNRMASAYGVPLRDVEYFFATADRAQQAMDQDSFLRAVEDYYYSDHRDSPVAKAIFSAAVGAA
jgi:Ca2+-binding EF-hand superfamily protein